MKQVSLIFLVKNNNGKKEILLAMKKRGFGKGKWNGVGGKFDEKMGDRTIEEAAIREAKEEIGVDVSNIQKVAVIDFYFSFVPEDQNWNQQVHVYFCDKWEGEPQESEEMAPQWFDENSLPYYSMWEDDKYWLPKALAGEKFKAKFVFDKNENVIKKETVFSDFE